MTATPYRMDKAALTSIYSHKTYTYKIEAAMKEVGLRTRCSRWGAGWFGLQGSILSKPCTGVSSQAGICSANTPSTIVTQ